MTRASVLPADAVLKRLRGARVALGYDRAKLAVLADLPYSTVVNLESGRRKDIGLGQLLALCTALEIDVRDVLTDEPIGIALGTRDI
jgi:transcriptional regulator with XRE-family HTH domain